MALKAGSCAAEGYETRQVREEAAVNSSFWVPQEYLARAGWPGQAAKRDQDPRAAYAIYDSESGKVTLHRVEYDIPAVQQRMLKVGLPQWLVSRLSSGR